jgi:Protein of unknown function (DUF1579)
MTAEGSSGERIEELGPFVGTWQMTASLASEPGSPPRADTTFEWLAGERFLIQRWRIDYPHAPDGIAIIGFDDDRATYLQRYFDSRGVARVYEMSFADGVWKLSRIAPGVSQRFIGTFNEAGDTISCTWESSSDGSTWEHDFDITYTRAP